MARRRNKNGKQSNGKQSAKRKAVTTPEPEQVSKKSKTSETESPESPRRNGRVTRSMTNTSPSKKSDTEVDEQSFKRLIDGTATPEDYDWRTNLPERTAPPPTLSQAEDEEPHEDAIPPLKWELQDIDFGPHDESMEERIRGYVFLWAQLNLEGYYPFTPPPEYLFPPYVFHQVSRKGFPVDKVNLKKYLTRHARFEFGRICARELTFYIQEEKQRDRCLVEDYDDTRKVRSTDLIWEHIWPATANDDP
ncbi:hypothetical protein KEM55_000762 [Ascosphaera atra]|nr:hypothetical protein KEM55_000762 [Ascosphaera atra]